MGFSLYRRTSIISAVIHGLLVLALIAAGAVQGCRYRKKKVELIEFSVAVDTRDEVSEAQPDIPSPPEPPRSKEPLTPPPLPPVKEPVAVPQPEPKRDLEKNPPPKKVVTKQPIVKGKRIVKRTKQPPVRQTLTDEEIAKWLGKRIPIGDQTKLPASDQAHNFAIVRNELYAAWDQPVRSKAGYRPAEAEFSLDSSGRISGVRIIKSSGSPVFDDSVLQAIRQAGRIGGLSAQFLHAFPRLSVEFKLDE